MKFHNNRNIDHNEPLKLEYEAADTEQKRRWAFEYDYMRDMRKYLEDCDRRIDGALRRLEKTPEEIRQTHSLVSWCVLCYRS